LTLSVKIKKRLGKFLLDVNIECGDESLAILGASGSGKSMTLKCIAGIEHPDEGEIVLNGRTLFDSENKINVPPRDRNVGILFQSYALFPNMTVEKNIAAGIRKGDIGTTDYIKMFRLEGLEKMYPRQLSGGQQQRVASARMLASDPEIVMLDEPFSALDSHLRWKLEAEITEHLTTFGKTSILVSHNRDEAYRMCEKIAVIDSGRCVGSMDKKRLFDDPRTVSAATMSGCKNIMRVTKTSEHEVFVKDWNAGLLTAPQVPDGTGYVGIRSHMISLNGTDNNIECTVRKVIESPFEHTLMLTVNGSSSDEEGSFDGKSVLYVDIDKFEDIEVPVKGEVCNISIPRDKVLPLV
jgi:molybdate transport system ATP-binding protein